MPTAFLLGVGKKTKKPTNWLTFSSAKPFTIDLNSNLEKSWDGTLYYSTDTTTWNEWDGTTVLASAEHEEEQRLYMSGSGNSKITIGISVVELYYWWSLTGDCVACSGNIESLLDFESVENGEHPPMAELCFAHLFQHWTDLVAAPELPATTLAYGCYWYMFHGCTSLTSVPKLPATTLAKYCYYDMFRKCSSLTNVPELPATTLAEGCYSSMFAYCTSLTRAPELPATTLAKHCYYYMFGDCTSLTTAPELPATTLAHGCYRYMFHGCTSLTSAPELPATTLAEVCYYYMFGDCTSLISVPKLPVITLADDYKEGEYGRIYGCYESMFNGCTNVKLSKTLSGEYHTAYRIPTSGTGTKATYSLRDMFTNTGGTFTGTPEINTTYYTSNTVV